MKFNKKPINVRAIFGTVLAALSMRSKRKQEQHGLSRIAIPRRRGTPGVNMSVHQQRMCAKRKVQRKMARKSRRVNRRVAQL